MTIYFLKDLARGKKTSKYKQLNISTFCLTEILSKNVRHISVPHYESLSLEKITQFCQRQPNDIQNYMPDRIEIHKVSREWICNIVATVLKNRFTDWVDEQIEIRNEEVREKKDMNIELDEDVAAAFNASTSVSCKSARPMWLYPFFKL